MEDAVVIPMDDANIHYVGRWDQSDPLAPWCAWQGSSLRVNFQGQGLLLDIDVGSSTEWFRVILNGDQSKTHKLTVTPGRKWIPLATGLPAGTHHLELVKETYAGGNVALHGLRVRGLGLTTPPTPLPRRIEFYGDSNLAGYSLEHEENLGHNKYVGVHFGFSGVLARRMQAECHNISASGETLGGMIQRFDRMQWYGEIPQWDFHRFTPEVVAQRQNPNMSCVHFPWVFESWHGCETDQAGFADVLASHLEQELGWTPLPSDVLNGLAVDGNVANGSFEGTAPFGGYAWRYRSDPRTERILDSPQAKDGTAFLRMWNGGTTHQPIPATNGDLVEVELWMRGQGSATLAVDFRDQEMYTAPMHSVDTIVNLQPQWTRVTLQVPAPSGTPRRIFHTRLTLTADAASGCDVDAVRTRIR